MRVRLCFFLAKRQEEGAVDKHRLYYQPPGCIIGRPATAAAAAISPAAYYFYDWTGGGGGVGAMPAWAKLYVAPNLLRKKKLDETHLAA